MFEDTDVGLSRRRKGGAAVAFADPESGADDVAGRAYLEQMVAVDGFTRTATGAVKYHKDTKKRRAAELEESVGDVEMEDATAGGAPKKSKKPQVMKLGKEFKAKVRECCRVTLSPTEGTFLVIDH